MVNTIYGMLNPKEQGPHAKAFLSALLYAHVSFPSNDDIDVYCTIKRENEDAEFTARIASPIGITDVRILDPSQETVDLYSELHKDIFTRIVHECISFDKEGSTSTIDINLKKFFATINEEMQGRIRLTFSPVKNQLEYL